MLPFTKHFDIDAFCASWPDAPVFDGERKKSLAVDQWLEEIERGCLERKVPKKHWHAVGQRFMSRHAQDRLYEVKKVMMSVRGGRFVMDWAKFKTAMKSMNWHIDSKRTHQFLRAMSGLWWIVSEEKAAPVEPTAGATSSQMFLKRTIKKHTTTADGLLKPPAKCEAVKSSSGIFSPSKSTNVDASITQKNASSKSARPQEPSSKSKSRTLVRMNKSQDPSKVQVVNAPEWLLTACQAVDALCEEYPQTMSVLAAVLTVIGAVPSTPAVSAGAAGAVLASGPAHALGSIAVGLGSWIHAQQNGLIDLS